MITGSMLRDALISGANRVAANSGEMNRINLFPVADGDTGANLTLTLGMAKQRLLRMSDDCTPAEVMRETADYMLRASRGNSGAILSAMARGAALRLSGKAPGDFGSGSKDAVSEKEFLEAMAAGTDAAYRAVSAPADGTMLTAARKTVRAGRRFLEQGERQKIESPADGGGSGSGEFWQELLDAGRRALMQTKYEMDLLRENEVVDAGALGFVSMLEGMAEVFLGNGICPEPGPGEADVERPYVFDREKVMRTDGALPTVTYVVNASFSGGSPLSMDLRKRLEPVTERLTLFLMKGSAEAKFGTDSPAAALKASLSSGGLREFSGFSHAADFKVRFSGSFPPAEEELRMACGAGSGFPGGAVPEASGLYAVVFTLLKDVREPCLRPEAEQVLLDFGRILALRESADALRCVCLTAEPGEVLCAAERGSISRGYMMDFVIVRHPGSELRSNPGPGRNSNKITAEETGTPLRPA